MRVVKFCIIGLSINIQGTFNLFRVLYIHVHGTYYLYSGYCLYFSNSINHSDSVQGSFSPRSLHVTIDKPDSVSRVTPPEIILFVTKVFLCHC